jgi:hypothetical protein
MPQVYQMQTEIRVSSIPNADEYPCLEYTKRRRISMPRIYQMQTDNHASSIPNPDEYSCFEYTKCRRISMCRVYQTQNNIHASNISNVDEYSCLEYTKCRRIFMPRVYQIHKNIHASSIPNAYEYSCLEYTKCRRISMPRVYHMQTNIHASSIPNANEYPCLEYNIYKLFNAKWHKPGNNGVKTLKACEAIFKFRPTYHTRNYTYPRSFDIGYEILTTVVTKNLLKYNALRQIDVSEEHVTWFIVRLILRPLRRTGFSEISGSLWRDCSRFRRTPYDMALLIWNVTRHTLGVRLETWHLVFLFSIMHLCLRAQRVYT